jgi:hypothetical protein
MNVRGVLTTGLIALVVTVAYQKYGAGAGMRRGA